ncbi:hypothetical protein HPP92_016127 [Vanilla planifolia]|uniref:Uncharacterized protein n=1 Tax=Vanilla planifolia TaxID=51239 RepID=A0A835UTX1_VANPL|nr:hypothetical protein HPP92_016127 [Vanilla planifolia]
MVIPPPEFSFDSSTMRPHIYTSSSLPYFSSYHCYSSAPSSPTAASPPAMFASFRHSYSVAYDGEEKSGKTTLGGANACEFAFEANGRQRGKVDRSALDADKLFEMGMIRPLKLPPRLYAPVMGERRSKSPPSNRVRILSPICRGGGDFGKEIDPFAIAMVEATRDRGRDNHALFRSESRKVSTSLSPFRGRGGGGGRGEGGFFKTPNTLPSPPPMAITSGSDSKSWKRRLKNLLLFRSSSKDSFRKNTTSPCSSSSSSSSSSFTHSVSLRSPKKKGFGGKSSRT